MSNRNYAVIGDPIAHSLSPLLHQTAFDVIRCGLLDVLPNALSDTKNISASYVAYQVKKEELAQFMDMFCGRKSTRVFRPLCLLKEDENAVNSADSTKHTNASDLVSPVASNAVGADSIPQVLLQNACSVLNVSGVPNVSGVLNVSKDTPKKIYQNPRMQGLSVTLPHKKEIMKYVDKITPLAMLVGAANTIYWEKDLLIAENTDVAGFLSPLHSEYLIKEYSITENAQKSETLKNDVPKNELLAHGRQKDEGILRHVTARRTSIIPAPQENAVIKDVQATPKSVGLNCKNVEGIAYAHLNNEKQTAMILGAGGAAAAVLVGLLHIPCMEKIYVCARNFEQAKNLCEHIKKIAHGNILSEQLAKSIFLVPEALSFDEKNKKVDLVVNTIPATLNGQFFNPRDDFEGVKIAYDLLYAHTPFLQAAKKQGVRVINGGEMFLQQGAKQFKLWTGKDIPQKALDKVQERIAKS